MYLDYLKALIYGILEGITEWLPISSTGHLLLLGQWLKMNVSSAFMEMFTIVIQLGAITAVIGTYFHELNPFSKKKTEIERKNTFRIWRLILISIIPSGIVGVLLDDWCDAHLSNAPTIAISLIGFGIIFVILEHYYTAENNIVSFEHMSNKKALGIGLFQVLSIVPGTSRSGSTMIGAMWLGLSRPLATQFSFFMAIPTMVGYSGLKLAKFFAEGNHLQQNEWIILSIAFFTALLFSFLVVKWLLSFVRRHSFLPFGIYRILLGGVILFSYFR